MRKLISLVLTALLLSQSLTFSVFAQNPSSTFHPQILSSTIYPLSSNFIYDSSGNLTSDGERSITWDASGMPSSITKGNTVVNFVYDGSGQRIGKIVKTDGQVTSSTIYFGNIEKEIDYTQSPAKQTITKYYFAGGKRIALRKNSDNPVYLHQDHLSSSTLFTNKDGNKVDSLITYHPYGTERKDWDLNPQLPITNYQLPTNYLYTDQIKDPETDLYYYNARYYSPTIGMFISADTAGDKLNKYAYASNNPIMFNDPTGHMDYDLGGGGLYIPPEPNPLTLSPPIIQTPIGATGVYDSTISYQWENPINQPDSLYIDEFMEALGGTIFCAWGCAPAPEPTLTPAERYEQGIREFNAEIAWQEKMRKLQSGESGAGESGEIKEDIIIEMLKGIDYAAGEFMKNETVWETPWFWDKKKQLAFLGLAMGGGGYSYIAPKLDAARKVGGDLVLLATVVVVVGGETVAAEHDATLWLHENYYPNEPFTKFMYSTLSSPPYSYIYKLGYAVGRNAVNSIFNSY